MRVVLVGSGCRAIPHLDADTGLDLGRTGKGKGVHDSLAHDRYRKGRRANVLVAGRKVLCHMHVVGAIPTRAR